MKFAGIFFVLACCNWSVKAGNVAAKPRQLDPISGGDVLRRKTESEVLFPGSDIVRALLIAAHVDSLGGGNILRALDGVTNGAVVRSLERLSSDEFLELLDEFRGGEALAVLDRITGGEILRTLDNIEGTEVLLALDKARRKTRDATGAKQRTLDTLAGMAFGEMKRMDSLSGASFGLSKRNFDEIDNVGFNNWSKRVPSRKQSLALAKRRPYHYSSLAKRDFDEIDRTGFEGFSKRDVKSSV